MKTIQKLVFAICISYLIQIALFAQHAPTDVWMNYEDPADVGYDLDKLQQVEAQFHNMQSAAFMVVQDGAVVLSLGDISRRFMAHSMRKSFLSAVYGIYEESGTLSLDKNLAELGIDDLQSLTEQEKSATIRNLITARSGIYHPAAYEPRGMKENRPVRGSAAPGETFFYNNWDFNTLGTIFNQETNHDFFDAFYDKIALPLQMEDLRPQDMHYRMEVQQSTHPAYLFKISARDLARFGQLYLNDGRWNGEQIIPQDWIVESTTNFSADLTGNPGRDGYGYLWWIDNTTFDQPAYYASGLGGHRLYVFPESNTVIVHRVDSYNNKFESNDKINALVLSALDARVTDVPASQAAVTPMTSSSDTQIDPVPIAKTDLEQYAGVYFHPFFQEITIVVEDQQLQMQGNILGNFNVLATSKGGFVIEDIEIPLLFERGSEANPAGTATTTMDDNRAFVNATFYY